MSSSAETSSQGEMYCPICERTFADAELCPYDATRLVSLSSPDDMIGRVLDGRYTLVAKLGGGGMGVVYRATQHSVGRDVAIKLIAANLVSDANAIKRFLREAKLASRLAHPNAVGVLDFGQTPDRVFYLVMELVEGRTLESVLEDEPVLSPKRAIRIASQICDAMEGAHRLQIVHRDLKPANVMVLAGSRDLIKVLDFGIARSLALTDTKMTNTGAAVGTPAFMSPEVASGEQVDARADLYSLGCMLYLMLTGRLPFAAATPHEMLAMHLTALPSPMTGVPDELVAVITRLLEKDPAARFPSADATREALEAAGNASPLRTSPSLPSIQQSNEAREAPRAVAVSPTALTAEAEQAQVQTGSRRRGWIFAATAALVVGAGLAAFALVAGHTHDNAEVDPVTHAVPGSARARSDRAIAGPDASIARNPDTRTGSDLAGGSARASSAGSAQTATTQIPITHPVANPPATHAHHGHTAASSHPGSSGSGSSAGSDPDTSASVPF